jgi:hypothetical protein
VHIAQRCNKMRAMRRSIAIPSPEKSTACKELQCATPQSLLRQQQQISSLAVGGRSASVKFAGFVVRRAIH